MVLEAIGAALIPVESKGKRVHNSRETMREKAFFLFNLKPQETTDSFVQRAQDNHKLVSGQAGEGSIRCISHSRRKQMIKHPKFSHEILCVRNKIFSIWNLKRRSIRLSTDCKLSINWCPDKLVMESFGAAFTPDESKGKRVHTYREIMREKAANKPVSEPLCAASPCLPSKLLSSLMVIFQIG
jgi:hypothetical protein